MNQHLAPEKTPSPDISTPNWGFPEMVKNEKSVTSDWELVNRDYIDGVRVKETSNVYTGYGHLTEIFRVDWGLDEFGVDQVFQGTFRPGGLSAWHVHAVTTDRLFVGSGTMLVVLYDARQDSPTYGKVNVIRAGEHRPAMVIVPPKVWHGVQNLGTCPATLINVVDHAYDYDGPDHYTIPWDSPKVPYKFNTNFSG